MRPLGGRLVLVLAALLSTASLSGFGAQTARNHSEPAGRPPVALFYEEKARIERESKMVFVDTLRTMVELEDLDSANAALRGGLTRLDALRDDLVEAGRTYQGHFEPRSLAEAIENVRGHQRHLISYTIGRTSHAEVRKLLGVERVDELFETTVAADPPLQRPQLAVMVLKPFRRTAASSDKK